jgi:transketolase
VPEVILMGTGSELSLCTGAHEALAAAGIRSRVVSMPSWELFEIQDQSYRDSVLPPSVTGRVAVELGAKLGWDRYVGWGGTVIGMHSFGASAPAGALLKKFGFTPEKVLEAARSQAKRGKTG